MAIPVQCESALTEDVATNEDLVATIWRWSVFENQQIAKLPRKSRKHYREIDNIGIGRNRRLRGCAHVSHTSRHDPECSDHGCGDTTHPRSCVE
jgi:hypothetical protein